MHAWSSRHLVGQTSPQSVSDSPPLRMPSEQLAARQTPSMQLRLSQSSSDAQAVPSGQPATQAPPQSTPTSSESLRPLLHVPSSSVQRSQAPPQSMPSS